MERTLSVNYPVLKQIIEYEGEKSLLKIFCRLKGLRGGGQGLADMSAKKSSFFYTLP